MATWAQLQIHCTRLKRQLEVLRGEGAAVRCGVTPATCRELWVPPQLHTNTHSHTHMLCVSLSLVYRPFAHSWQHLIIEKEATIRQFAQFASLHLPRCPYPSPFLLCLVVPRRVSRSLSSRRRRRQSPVPARPVQMFVDKFTDVPSVLCESLPLSLTRLADAITRWGTRPPPPRNCMLHVKGEIWIWFWNGAICGA